MINIGVSRWTHNDHVSFMHRHARKHVGDDAKSKVGLVSALAAQESRLLASHLLTFPLVAASEEVIRQKSTLDPRSTLELLEEQVGLWCSVAFSVSPLCTFACTCLIVFVLQVNRWPAIHVFVALFLGY